MPHIQQLESHVADLIAAGEVVERPASVVKELVENAIDAGATAVVVEIQRGGMGLIRVTDNGCGIAPEELPTAFLRHATSKLRTAADLGKIGTLGFRGEALAAISAVSRTDILTRQHQAQVGASLHLEGGVAGTVESAGAPEGTTMLVRDLFYNTPARLKFMRKDSAETAAVAGLMQHLALSHPDVSFKFIKDGTETLHTPGDGKLDSAIYAALGRDFARSLVAVEGRGDGVTVSGFVTKPLMGRGSRSMQTFFVNGRYIKSQLLTAALEEGYRNQIMKGKFPGCVLSVTLPVTAERPPRQDPGEVCPGAGGLRRGVPHRDGRTGRPGCPGPRPESGGAGGQSPAGLLSVHGCQDLPGKNRRFRPRDGVSGKAPGHPPCVEHGTADSVPGGGQYSGPSSLWDHAGPIPERDFCVRNRGGPAGPGRVFRRPGRRPGVGDGVPQPSGTGQCACIGNGAREWDGGSIQRFVPIGRGGPEPRNRARCPGKCLCFRGGCPGDGRASRAGGAPSCGARHPGGAAGTGDPRANGAGAGTGRALADRRGGVAYLYRL